MIELIALTVIAFQGSAIAKTTLKIGPTGLDFQGNRARNLMYRPSRANAIGTNEFTVDLGNSDHPTFHIWKDGGTLLIDFKQSGKAEDRTKVVGTANESKEPGAPKSYQTTVVFPVPYVYKGKTTKSSYGLNFYWSEGRNDLFYFRATLASGTITIGGRQLKVELREDGNRGVYGERFDTSKDPATANPTTLTLQGGNFDARGSFVIDGVNYLADITPDGKSLTIRESARIVAAPPRPQAPDIKLLADGTKAPDFTVEKYEGGTTKLSEHLGKVVILKFWATWCGPCKASMPHFQEIYGKVNSQGVDLLAVCVSDERQLFKDWVQANSESYKFPFSFDPAGRDSATSISRKLFGVTGIPTVFIIDREGKVSSSIVGYSGPNDHRVEEALRKLDVKL